MSRTLTWEEIDKDWSGLQKRQRMEIAAAVARYCVGHKVADVADRLGQSRSWVLARLDMAGVSASFNDDVGGPTSWTGKERGLQEDCEKVARDFAPKVEVKYEGRTKDKIASVDGDDADAFDAYLDHYLNEGHEPAAAVRLAKAEWAGEAAKEAGVIKESVNKRNEKVNQILFPEKPRETFDIDLQMHMNRVEQAARFLDEAKVNFLRRKSTCERVASAHEKWLEQVERVLNFNTTLTKD